MKKMMIFLLGMVLLVTPSFAKESSDISVYLNGQVLVFDTQPVIIEGRTMVPVRAIFEAFNMEVAWHSSERKVTATKEGLVIELWIGSTVTQVNGQEVVIDSQAYIDNGRTMVPLRFIAESTGAHVTWDGQTRTVIITSGYNIVDTGLDQLFTDQEIVESIPQGQAFYGQDGHYEGYQPSYLDHGDGTVTDLVTGLMWQQTMDEKMTYDQAVAYANDSNLGGYNDWRLPTIKELFSLIQFTGQSGGEVANILYIDTDYFDQPLGDTSQGEREIDAQTWSVTKYVGTTMHGDPTVFGVNFIDGRIKGYGLIKPKTQTENLGYFRLVRGHEDYGQNIFIDNGDGTVSDLATGLMWQKADDGQTRDWESSLAYAEDLSLGGYDDWRLPNIKELQSLVDYTKSPSTSQSPAINDLFVLSPIIDPNGESNFGFYWSSTSHQDGRNIASSASYVAFGEAQGEMFGSLLDVHGAGAVRSDPKSGSELYYPDYFGPQGDIRYVYNFVLAVRTIE